MTLKTDNEKAITDEMFDEMAKKYEDGSWDSQLGKVVVGRPGIANEKVKPITFRLSISKIAAIDEQAKSKGKNRSEYLRGIVEDALKQAL